jgi:putative phosphoesterase
MKNTTAEPLVAEPTTVSTRRIGLLADNHSSQDDGSDLPDEVFEAFGDVGLIVHLGHLGVREQLSRGVLDRLERIAPVLAVRDYSTDKDGKVFITPPEGNRVAGVARVIEVDGLRIGAIHNLSRDPGPEIPAPPGGIPEIDVTSLGDALEQMFGGRVNVVAFAGTHRAVSVKAGDVLFVNPGSPTYPKGPGRAVGKWALGTVGILEVSGGVVSHEVVELSVLASAQTSS